MLSIGFDHVLIFVEILLFFVVSKVISVLFLTKLFDTLLLLTKHVTFFVILLFFFKHHVFQKLFLIASKFHGVSIAVGSTAVSASWLHCSTFNFIIMIVHMSLIYHHFIRMVSIMLELIFRVALLVIHLVELVVVLYRMISWILLLLLKSRRSTMHQILIFLMSKIRSLIMFTNFVYLFNIPQVLT